MHQSIMATLNHAMSTDDAQKHDYVQNGNIPGAYKHTQAKDKQNPGPHQEVFGASLNTEVAEVVRPIYMNDYRILLYYRMLP